MELDLRSVIGLGVAGNFTGHLEQAGEASDFAGVEAEAGKPKGVFPFYVPPPENTPGSGEHFLHTYPLSRDTIEHPGTIAGRPAKLQIEPEVALLCELVYADGDGGTRAVADVRPTYFTAYNDCSTRRPDATKISQKKNWGANTKGLADDQWIALDRFEPGGVLDRFRLACFLRRGDELLAYGEDSPVAGPGGYGTMYRPLLDWLVDRLNHQRDTGPLEDMPRWLEVADYPERAVISIGATRYTAVGESTFLEPGDEAIVVVYDGEVYPAEALASRIDGDQSLENAACLRQRVVARS
ncbi:MAG: DUF5718 family protein [Planctomycetota bacterium]